MKGKALLSALFLGGINLKHHDKELIDTLTLNSSLNRNKFKRNHEQKALAKEKRVAKRRAKKKNAKRLAKKRRK